MENGKGNYFKNQELKGGGQLETGSEIKERMTDLQKVAEIRYGKIPEIERTFL